MDVNLNFILILIGLTGIHIITTVSELSVKAGGSVSIPCGYDSQYINNVKYLCKGYSWVQCSYVFRTDQQSSRKYSISDDKSRRIFTVTIKDLTVEDTDYWCAVEINGRTDKKAYFHLSVTRAILSPTSTSEHVTHASVLASKAPTSKHVTHASVLASKAPTSEHVTHASVFASEAPTAHGGHFSSTNLSTSFSIRLTLLVLFVTVTSFIWFMVKRHMRIKLDSSATTTTTTTAETEVRYMRRTSDERSHAESEVEGI